MEAKRDLLDILRSELALLEHSQPNQTPWKSRSIFQDSPTCLRREQNDQSLCAQCPLLPLVPVILRSEDVPCHHIPLDAEGETIHGMERQCTQKELETTVKNWLRATILDSERKGPEGSASKQRTCRP